MASGSRQNAAAGCASAVDYDTTAGRKRCLEPAPGPALDGLNLICGPAAQYPKPPKSCALTKLSLLTSILRHRGHTSPKHCSQRGSSAYVSGFAQKRQFTPVSTMDAPLPGGGSALGQLSAIMCCCAAEMQSRIALTARDSLHWNLSLSTLCTASSWCTDKQISSASRTRTSYFRSDRFSMLRSGALPHERTRIRPSPAATT
jgi:hypothetical protein